MVTKVMSDYEKFDAYLLAEGGIDFGLYIKALRSSGNETGIYSDVALLLYRLVASPTVSTILEFGSGMSTCILSKAAQDHNKHLVTMEHIRKWYDVTSLCLDSLGIPSPNYICTESDSSTFATFGLPVDVVWVDGCISSLRGEPGFGRHGSCDFYAEHIKKAVLLFDDVQDLNNATPLWLRSFGRNESSELLFNPTGRGDRHVLVSFPAADHPLRSVVDSCIL